VKNTLPVRPEGDPELVEGERLEGFKSKYILGIETSCDETGAAVFDVQQNKVLASELFSQIKEHEKYGGVVPEIASRSQLEKIDVIVARALEQASITSQTDITLKHIDAIAVTHKPGLVGSLLIGICFAKALSWAANKKLIGINHLEGHIFSSFLQNDNTVNTDIPFPHISLVASGGHTALYLVKDFGKYELLGQTLDDATGEAFDKIAKILGFGYPGGAVIEKMAREVNFTDFFSYPRTKNKNKEIMFSFSGLKTAVLYHLVKMGAYDLHAGPIKEKITLKLQQQVASSLLVCIADIFEKNIQLVFKKHPTIQALTFGGGVACNKYLTGRLENLCAKHNKTFYSPPPKFCTDNGAMIAFVGSYKAQQNKFSDLYLDASR